MPIFFPDISEFQWNPDFTRLRAQTPVIAARTAYGDRLDKTMPERRDKIRAAEFDVVIWYVFMRSSVSIQQQFETTRKLLGVLRPNETICVDWEADINGTVPSAQQRDQLIYLFEEWAEHPVLVYSGAYLASTQPCGATLWVASYNNTRPQISHAIWQYTNGTFQSHLYATITWDSIGQCDTSVFEGTIDELKTALSLNHMEKGSQSATHTFGDQMNRTVFKTPNLDTNGNGWIQTTIPFEHFVNLVPFGPAPDRDSYSWKNWYWSVNDTGGNVKVEIEGGPPSGTISFAVWSVE